MMLVWQLGPALAGLEKLGLNTSLELKFNLRNANGERKVLQKRASMVRRKRFTSEASSTGAVVSTGHIPAGPSVHAWVGLTLVVVDVTVGSTPPRVAAAFVAKVQKTFTFLSYFHFAPMACTLLFANLDLWSSVWRSPIDEILAAAVDAGVAAALVHLRQAGGVVVALWAQASEAIDAVHAGAPIVARVDGAFVNVDVAH